MDEFYNAIRKDISMVKGDTLSFNFQLQGLESETPTSLYFTCRDKPESENYYFQRALNNGINLISYDNAMDIETYSVRVLPSQTENLSVGRYYYDLQLTVNDDVITLMKGRINLDWDVTRG